MRKYLLNELPEYMIPPFFVPIEKVPLSPNGKVDRKALPEPELPGDDTFVAPRNDVEKKLAEVWSKVLKIDKSIIGIDVSFFELGGHSLNATILVSRIHKELNVKIPLGEIFRIPIIRELFDYINEVTRSEYTAIQMVEKKEYYESSSAQRRLYILQRMKKEDITYNSPLAVLLNFKINEERLAKTFMNLIKRHESLRTSFTMIDEKAIQIIHEEVEFEISYLESREAEARELIRSMVTSFDLSKAPLLRVALIRLDQERQILFVDMHHIITDGISMMILIKEFLSFYNEEELPRQKLQYKDFSEWQNSEQEKEAVKKQEAYWLKKFAGELPTLNLPVDYDRTAGSSHKGDELRFALERKLVDRIKRFVSETGTTLYIVLLAAYNVLLSKYTAQEDIIVGTASVGRTHADLENIIGFFVNMLPMRNYPTCTRTFREFLEEVKENSIKAFENQNYPYEELVWKLSQKNNLGYRPLVNTVFEIQNVENPQAGMQEIAAPGANLRSYEIEDKTAKFDLILFAFEFKNEILFAFRYRSSMFRKKTIERMAIHLENIIDTVLDNPDIILAEIDLLGGREKNVVFDEIESRKGSQESLVAHFDF